jgi:hypothetical protein
MSEAGMRSNLVAKLRDLDAVAIESRGTGIGIPDVNYIGGWIECKWLREWPKNADTRPVIFSHPLTIEQGIWLYRRSLKGGTCFVCCQVGREWFFFDGLTIKERFNKMTRGEMVQEALLYFDKGLDSVKLIAWLNQHSKG